MTKYVIRERMSENIFESQAPPCWVAKQCGHAPDLAMATSPDLLRKIMAKKYPGMVEDVEDIDEYDKYGNCAVCDTRLEKAVNICKYCGEFVCRECLAEYDHRRDGEHLVTVKMNITVPAKLSKRHAALELSDWKFFEVGTYLIEKRQVADRLGLKIMFQDCSNGEPDYTEI